MPKRYKGDRTTLVGELIGGDPTFAYAQ